MVAKTALKTLVKRGRKSKRGRPKKKVEVKIENGENTVYGSLQFKLASQTYNIKLRYLFQNHCFLHILKTYLPNSQNQNC